LNSKTLGLVVMAFAAAFMAAEPAMAQSRDGGTGRIRGERVLPGRVGGDETDRQDQRDRQRAPRERRQAAPTGMPAEQITANAQGLLTATNTECQMSEATNPGANTAGQTYEVACSGGPGYILIASTPPQAFNCVELAGTAIITRERDPSADVGQQCVLPANQNSVAVIGGYAREAGVTCNVDEAMAIGQAGTHMIYEVGCAGVDGYRLERQPTRWEVVDCLQVMADDMTCRFTTPAEQNATLKAQLAGTEAAACDVQAVHLMGHNANGRFIEVKCATEGEGYIARIKDGATQEIYPCATARQRRIGNGCELTPSPAAAGGRP
jgi:hypothetical protein